MEESVHYAKRSKWTYIIDIHNIYAVFEYGRQSIYLWNERGMYLEDLYLKRDPYPQTNLHELGMSYFLAENGTPDQVYERAIANLKKAAPNLQILWLIGGYHFNPYWKVLSQFL